VTIDGEIHTGINRQVDLILKQSGDTVYDDSTETGEIGFSIGTRTAESELIIDLNYANDQLDLYGENDANLKAFYTSEVTRITAELTALGMWEIDSNGFAGYDETEVRVISVDPVSAQAGFIDIRGDGLTGNGVIDAPGDANVTIENHTQAYLDLSSIEIPDTNGGLYLNGTEVTSNSDVNAMNSSATSENDAALSDDFTIADATFSAITDNDAIDPIISIQNVSSGSGRLPDITVNGDLTNYRGTITIANTNNSGDGNIYIYGNTAAKQVNITAGGSLVVSGVTKFQTGSEGYALIAELGDGDILTSSQGESSAAISSQVKSALMNSSSNLVIADRITIDASWVNLNGTLQSGEERLDLVLGAEATDFINGLSANASGKKMVVGTQ
jgi:hypothetical protein